MPKPYSASISAFDGFRVSRTRVEGYGHSGPTRYEVADSLFNVEDEVEDSRSEH